LTKRFDRAVKPVPILQIINLVLSLFVLAWEWPLGLLADTILHRSIKARVFALPFPTLAAAILYQGTDPAIYYVIGTSIYFWAAISGETIQGGQSHHSSSRGHAQEPVLPSNTTLTAPISEVPLESQSLTRSQTRRVLSITAKKYLPPSVNHDTSPYFDPLFRIICGSLYRHLVNILSDAPRASEDIAMTQRLNDTIEDYTRV
jgi:hypothetical protein